MAPRVFTEFRMESCGHGSSLPDRDGIAAFGSEHFDSLANLHDLWSTDEHHLQRRRIGRIELLQVMLQVSQKLPFPDGTVDLAAVGVAADADVQGPESGLRRVLNFGGQQDCASAGPKRGFSLNELL